jgi:flagellar motility protein MotE (MotC chaperone)
MKPKEAARVFDKLELSVLVPVVNAMNPRKMAEVLAAMSPEAASKLTVELATKGQRQQAQAPRPAGLPAGELLAIEPKRP